MSEKEKAESPQSPDNAAAIFSGPAWFSNKVYVTVTPMGFRLTFMESYDGAEEQFRTAVFLSLLDVVSLKGVIDRQLENISFSVEPTKVAASSDKDEQVETPESKG